jgi:hypothetical protein
LWIDDVATLAHINPRSIHGATTPGRALRSRAPFQNFRRRSRARTPMSSSRPSACLPLKISPGDGTVKPPVWINLEYLSAEAWVESAHALPSPHRAYAHVLVLFSGIHQ